jgi:uncharacterized membrane protein (UPF0127 family)
LGALIGRLLVRRFWSVSYHRIVKFPLSNKNAVLFTLLVVTIFGIVTACSTNNIESHAPPTPEFITSSVCGDQQFGQLGLTEITLSVDEIDINLQVELADEPDERAQGFMCRKSVPAGTGMLFIYPTPRTSGFWMFNTYVPIDILFIDRSHRVVDNLTMTPCLREAAGDDDWRAKCATEATKYVPENEWLSTLELPAGWLESVGIDNTNIANLKVDWISVAD